MNDSLRDAAHALVARAKQAGQSGSTLTDAEALTLQEDAQGALPQWYLELLLKVPLAGLEFEYGEADEDGDRPHALLWNGATGIRSESLECYPGLAILERGYFNCASDPTGGGDPYFVGPEVDGVRPVYQVYHDVGDQADDILADGLKLVAPSLAVLLDGGICDE